MYEPSKKFRGVMCEPSKNNIRSTPLGVLLVTNPAEFRGVVYEPPKKFRGFILEG